ncbi:MAG: hypothetical protein HC808_18855 [Candidatus Competibacteraceae bacterium]|nr:hypothetical protein [Candidatus Competibacteraceae bacterium]
MSREPTAPTSPDSAPSPAKLCLTFTDRVGIVADIARILSEHAISITAMEVEVESVSHGVQVYLALDIGRSGHEWEQAQHALAAIHGLQKVNPFTASLGNGTKLGCAWFWTASATDCWQRMSKAV